MGWRLNSRAGFLCPKIKAGRYTRRWNCLMAGVESDMQLTAEDRQAVLAEFKEIFNRPSKSSEAQVLFLKAEEEPLILLQTHLYQRPGYSCHHRQ